MITQALSIRQPWVEMILNGQKRVEMRQWTTGTRFRGPFLIHAAMALDWRSVPLFGYENALDLPRGGVVGAARVVDVHELDVLRWCVSLTEHWVVRQRRTPQYGLVLADVVRFPRVLRCGGSKRFFPVPSGVANRSDAILTDIDWKYRDEE